MNDGSDRPSLGGWHVPRLSTAVWITVVASVLGYFAYGRAVANIVAIAGAILVTVVAVVRDRFERGADRREVD